MLGVNEALMGLRGVIEVGEVDLEDEETIEKLMLL